MAITEEQIMEALGVGANGQEVAEPAAQPPEDQDQNGANGQEVAEPAEPDHNTEPAEEPAGQDAEDAPGDQPTDKTMTPEQRRANAARRRQAEQQAAIDAAVEAALKNERERHSAEMTEFFGKAGLKNSITGKPITSMEDFRTWNQEFEQQRLQRELKSGKLTTEGLAAAIGNHPVVQQAQQLLEQNQQAQRTAEQTAARQRLESEIAEIHKIDQSITSMEDLTAAPYWPQLYAMTKRGYSVKDAHFLLNHERLEQAKLEGARNQALANARGKEHLKGTAPGRGGGQISVPAADMAMFRALNPKASDADIQAFYNQYQKTRGG